MNTDNMTRITAFNLLLPRRQLFKLTETKSGIEPKEKLTLSDFQLYWEQFDEAKRRLYDSFGLVGIQYRPTSEILDQKEIDKRLIKINVKTRDGSGHPLPDKGQDPKEHKQKLQIIESQLTRA